MPFGVVAPAQVSEQLVGKLDRLSGSPWTPVRCPPSGPRDSSSRTGRSTAHSSSARAAAPTGCWWPHGGGASLAQAVELVVRAAEKAEHRTVRTVDVTPAARGDSRSLSSFYLVVGWCVGGYLCAAILAISAGARPSNGHRAVIRLAALALYAIVAGLVSAIIVGPVLGALPGTFFGLWGWAP